MVGCAPCSAETLIAEKRLNGIGKQRFYCQNNAISMFSSGEHMS